VAVVFLEKLLPELHEGAPELGATNTTFQIAVAVASAEPNVYAPPAEYVVPDIFHPPNVNPDLVPALVASVIVFPLAPVCGNGVDDPPFAE
jgi:hypothetical protein